MPSARGDALGFVYQAGGRLLGLVLSFASLTVTVRYLGRAGYGEVTAIVAFLGLWECFTDFGVGAAVVQRAGRRPEQLLDDVRAAFGLSLGYCGLLALVAGLSAWAFLGHYGSVTTGIALVALGLAATTIATTWQPLFQRSSTYYPLALGDLAGRAAGLGLVVVAAAAGWEVNGVLGALAASPLARLALVTVFARRLGADRPSFSTVRWRALVSAALPIGATQIVALLYYRADAVLLSVLSTREQVGGYGLALRLLAPVMFVPSLILTGGLARLSQAHAEGPAPFNALLSRLVRYVLVIAVALVALGLPAAPAAIRLVGGGEFATATTTVRLVIVATGFVFLNAVWSVALTGAGRQRLLLRLGLVGLLVNLVGNLLLIPRFDAAGAAVALTVSEVASAVSTFAVLRRVTGFQPTGGRWVVLPGAALAGFCVVAAAPSPLRLPAAVVGLAVYVAVLFGLRFVALPEVRAVLRRESPATA